MELEIIIVSKGNPRSKDKCYIFLSHMKILATTTLSFRVSDVEYLGKQMPVV